MKLSDLITVFRRRVDDTVAPYLWGDSEVKDYLNEAVREAAIRSLLILDDSTAGLTQINVVAGTSSYQLSPLVVEVKRARLSLEALPMTPTGIAELDEMHTGWEDLKGHPKFFVEDGGKIRLFPTPIVNDTLKLRVYRQPLVDMTAANDVPEIPAEYHTQLVAWAVYRAFLKRDADTYDEQKAQTGLVEFESAFGVRPDANVRRKRRERRAGTVRFNPF